MENPVDSLSPSPILTDQPQYITSSEYSTITHKPAVPEDPDCIQNCVYAQFLKDDCTHHEKDGNRVDDACLCRNINSFIRGDHYHNCFAVCSDKQSMKEITGVILDVCKAVGVQINPPRTFHRHPGLRVRGVHSDPKVSTTRSTTLPWGLATWSLTTNGVFSIGYPNTIPSRTFYSTTTLYPGDHGYTTTIADPVFPYVTQVIGISVPTKTLSASSTTGRSRQPPKSSPISLMSSESSTDATLTTSAIPSTLTTSISASSIVFIPIPSSATSAHGLATGATVGIAVAIPMVVIGFFVAYMVWFIRRRERIKNGVELPVVSNAAQMDQIGSNTKNSSSSAALNNLHAEASGTSVNELGGLHVGNPRFELDSTLIQIPQPPHTIPPSSGYTYIPYRRPHDDDDDVLSTRCSKIQPPDTNNQVIGRSHLGTLVRNKRQSAVGVK